MHKFDSTEDTKSGKTSSRNTILIIFQKKDEKNKETVYTPAKTLSKERSVDTVLECQKILSFSKLCKGDSVQNLVRSTRYVQNILIRLKEYNTCASRNQKRSDKVLSIL